MTLTIMLTRLNANAFLNIFEKNIFGMPVFPHPTFSLPHSNMGLTQNAKGSGGGSSKNPLITKKGDTVKQTKKSHGKGMMFTLIDEFMEVKTHVSYDPVFDTVVGFQASPESFLTAEIVDHMKSVVAEKYSDVDVSSFSFPLTSEGAVELVLQYASCTKACKGGETSGAYCAFVTTL